jgi:predicted DNA-binding protein (MmcQ/YjbR family)
MNIETFREYCLAKPGVEEGFPFGPETLVFKVMGKIFALTGLDETEFKVNLKCDPQRAVELREQFPESILPGYHMNKQHWNTVHFDHDLSSNLLCELTDHSYQLIAQSLRKSDQEKLKNQ